MPPKIEQTEQTNENANNQIVSNEIVIEQPQQPIEKKFNWVDADVSFFPFLKNGFHFFKVYGLKKSDTWERENGTSATLYFYRCMPIDADNLEECADVDLYPVFRSYEDIRKNSKVICKKSEGIFQVFSIDQD